MWSLKDVSLSLGATLLLVMPSLLCTTYNPKIWRYYDHWTKLIEHFIHSKHYWNQVEHGIFLVVDGEILLERNTFRGRS